MPGLVGFSSHAPFLGEPRRVLEAMLEGLMHRPFYRRSPSLVTQHVTAAQVVSSPHVHRSALNSTLAEQEGIYAWFDGEIYRGKQLCEEMGRAMGISWDPHASDIGKRLLLSAYLTNQHEKLLARLDGIFCAVLYDSKAQTVHLISDRYGLRRLYWTVYQQTLVWVPELKALLDIPGYQPQLDKAAVEDFLGLRYILGDRSFFENVELLPAATILTWNIRESTIQKKRYWHWSDLLSSPQRDCSDHRAIEDALAHSLHEAVRVRCQPHESVGITLSGGLDSRALLATASSIHDSIPCLTFGQRNCQDVRLAQQVTELAHAPLHVIELTAQNWLAPRIQSLWEMDAPCSILHAHFSQPSQYVRQHDLFNVNLHGDWGGRLSGRQFFPPEKFDHFIQRQLNLDGFARSPEHKHNVLERGRAYFKSLGSSSYVMAFDSRMRSYTSKDMRINLVEGIETRFPFVDVEFQTFIASVPMQHLMEACPYHRVLDRYYPALFQHVPWQATGLPVAKTLPKQGLQKHIETYSQKIRHKLGWAQSSPSKASPLAPYAKEFADYPEWLRQEPTRSFVDTLFNSSARLYDEFLNPTDVKRDWEQHLSGANLSDRLGTVMTLEVWLQQLFNGKYRTGS